MCLTTIAHQFQEGKLESGADRNCTARWSRCSAGLPSSAKLKQFWSQLVDFISVRLMVRPQCRGSLTRLAETVCSKAGTCSIGEGTDTEPGQRMLHLRKSVARAGRFQSLADYCHTSTSLHISSKRRTIAGCMRSCSTRSRIE